MALVFKSPKLLKTVSYWSTLSPRSQGIGINPTVAKSTVGHPVGLLLVLTKSQT